MPCPGLLRRSWVSPSRRPAYAAFGPSRPSPWPPFTSRPPPPRRGARRTGLVRHARQKLAVRILLRGMEGFGHRHHLCTDTSLTLSEDLPLAAIAVDTRSNIETVLDQALELTRHGLITLERARLLSDEIDPVGIVDHAAKPLGCVSFSAATTGVYGVPAVEVICELLHRRGIVGAAVLPGVDGTAHGRHQRPQFFSRNAGAR